MAQFHDVFCLLAKEADRLDLFGQRVETKINHLLGRVRDLEQRARGFVDANVSGLRTQGDSDNQRVNVHMLQLTLWFGIGGLKTRKNLADRVVIKLLSHGQGVCGHLG